MATYPRPTHRRYVHGDVKPENFLVGRRLPSAAASAAAAAKATASRGAAKRRRTRNVSKYDVDEDYAEEVEYQETGADDVDEADDSDDGMFNDLEYVMNRQGLFMVDLGLGLNWTLRDGVVGPTAGHAPYRQRIDHFSGTVR